MGSWPFSVHRKGVCSTTSGTFQRNFFLMYFFPLLRNDLGRAQIWVVAACAALQLGTPLGFARCHSCQCFLLYSWHQMGIFSELVLTNVDERAEIHY